MTDGWQNLFGTKRLVVGLSPMDGVTDVVMRYLSAKYSGTGLGVMFTEFVSVDALAHVMEPRKVEQVLRALIRARDVVGEGDTVTGLPLEIAQVFGHTPELFYQAAVLVAALGFEGMDINMGCPAHKVEDLGSGAGLIRTPKVAQEIVRQAKQGLADFAAGRVGVDDLDYAAEVKTWVSNHTRSVAGSEPLPVSVKTRIGVSAEQVADWIPALLEVQPAVISLHGRTLRQLYQGRADWEAIGRAAELVHKVGGKILGNGDVQTVAEASEKVAQYGVDGVLMGRAAEGNPAFAKASEGMADKEQRMKWILEHAKLYDKMFVRGHDDTVSQLRAFVPLRKHLAWYASGFPGASELRQRLVITKSLGEVVEIVTEMTEGIQD